MGKFKVGDKVKTNKWGDGTEIADGLIGTVEVADGVAYPYGIRLESGHLELAGCTLPIWCFEYEIEPVDG